MYLRETRRRNADGTEVAYLALAHNERDPETGMPKAKIVHNFGRADLVDREGLRRLVRSISRFLDPADAVAATASGEVSVIDARPMGAAYLADALWRRIGIADGIAKVAARRRVDPELVERVIFSMVANRLSVRPLSKLAGCTWVTRRVFIEGLEEVSDDACYRAMDFLLSALPELQEQVFFSVANLLNLEVDVLFFDTSSTYFELDHLADELEEDAGETDAESDDDEEQEGLEERAMRAWSKHSKDHRPDLPQVVLGMAVTREGIPVRVWSFPGTTSDQVIIRKVKDDLGAWGLHRVIWCLDRGFNSAENRRYLQRAGGHYIVGERLRSDSTEAKAALARAGRYREVAGNLRVKEVRVGTERFVICHNPERARRDEVVRGRIVAHLEARIEGSDRLPRDKRLELYGALSTKSGLKRFLRLTKDAKLRIDKAAIRREVHFDGKFLLRSSDEALSAEELATGYKALYEAERGWRDLKSTIDLRPVFHRREDRIRAHVQLCWLALLLARVAELGAGDTWRNLRNELERLHLVTMATNEGTVSQRSELTPAQRAILSALEVPEPRRFYDFTPAPELDEAS
jgi:hypothetical protein